MFEMGSNKAPGPDGMCAAFYEGHWSILGCDVIKMCLRVLNYGQSIVELNNTHIYLIPEVKSLTKVSEFRPISLCNVL